MTSPTIHLDLFGGLRIRRDGAPPADFSTQQTGALLAALALRLGGSYTREELADLIWRDDDADAARHRLRQRLHALRQCLEPSPTEPGSVLVTSRSVIRLAPEAVSTDVAEFDALLHRASQTDDLTARRETLAEAVGLYGGELLPGFYLDPIVAERNRLSVVYRGALGQLVRLLEQAGQHDRAVEIVGRALVVDPFNEECHCDLMRLHAALGQPSSVTRQYRHLEQILARELDVAPTEETRLRYESLREEARSVADKRASSAPPPHRIQHHTPIAPETVATSRRTSRQRARLWWVMVPVCTVAAFTAFWAMRSPRGGSSGSIATPPLPATRAWVYRYAPTGTDGDSEATAIVRGDGQSFYVTGFIQTASSDADFLTLKLDNSGNVLWEKRYDGPGNDVDRARLVAFDAADNSVYVAGESDNGKGNGTTRLCGLDVALIKYSSNGKELWRKRYNDIDDGEDRPRRLALGRGGGVYLLCACRRKRGGRDAGQDFVVVKYRGADGHLEWVGRYDGDAHGDDEPVDMAVTPEGAVYATGSTSAMPHSGPELDFLTLKLKPDGTRDWAIPFGSSNRADDRPRGIHLDPSGSVWVVGEGLGLPDTADEGRRGCVAVKYSATGAKLGNRGTSGSWDRLTDVRFVAPLGDGVVIAGMSADTAGPPIARVMYRDSSFLPVWVQDTGPARHGSLTPSALVTTSRHEPALILGDLVEIPTISAAVELRDNRGRLAWRADLSRDGGPMYPRAASGGLPGFFAVAGQARAGKTKDLTVVCYTNP